MAISDGLTEVASDVDDDPLSRVLVVRSGAPLEAGKLEAAEAGGSDAALLENSNSPTL